MKNINLLSLIFAGFLVASACAQTLYKNVQKTTDGNNRLVESLAVPTGKTLAVETGAILTTAAGTTTLTSPILVTPALGTPSSGVATNLTGTAAGMTAGTVLTNANLTGPITSAGNATSVAAQTGTGSTFVMAAAPAIVGGSHTALTGLGVRSTGAGAFDLTLANAENLTASRTLTIQTGDAARTLILGASPAVSGANTGDQTITLTGDATGSGTASFAVNVAKINGVALSGLATGILKNTTTTGVPSIAVAGDFPVLNQSTTGSAATLTTPRALYGNNFDGSAALTQIIASTYGGTGNGFTKFSGPTTTEKTFTLPDANATLLYSGGPLGTPSSGVATNLTGTSGITGTGALNAGSITSGFGSIDVGADSITGGAISGTTGTFTGTVRGSGELLTIGAASVTTASSGRFEYAGSSISRIVAIGADAATYGQFAVLVQKSDGTNFSSGLFTSTGLNNTVIGATTPAAGSFTTLSAAYSGGGGGLALTNSSDTSGTSFSDFKKAAGTTIGSITRVTTTDAVAYNTTSDGRLKTNVRDFTAADSGRIIDGLRPRWFDWRPSELTETVEETVVTDKLDKDGEPVTEKRQKQQKVTDAKRIADHAVNNKSIIGFIAQEEAAVDPALVRIGAVTVGDDDPDTISKQWARSDAALVPILVAELQSLRARVAALEAKNP